jgi:O-succinylbenzoic acid--CoA ligase
MQAVRALISGGRLVVSHWQQLVGDLTGQSLIGQSLTEQMDARLFFISLVPTQLQRLLQAEKTAHLREWQAILLGGAPAALDLLTQAQAHRLPLALTYGMTETAAGVTILKPAEFWAGARHCGQPLPHAQIEIVDDTGLPVARGNVGQVVIRATSLAQGYCGKSAGQWQPAFILSDDLGYLDPAGNLQIVGRSSEKIITGGENVYAPEVEAAILATGLVADVVVLGRSDSDWGERLVALYVPLTPSVTAETITAQLQTYLSKFKQPKQWIAVTDLPRNALGKVNRELVQAQLTQADLKLGSET